MHTGGRRFAISDIHGCAKTLRHALFESIRLRKTDQLFLLGDYIDRGPDSRDVLDCIMDLQLRGYKVQALRGNHEQLMLDAYNAIGKAGAAEALDCWIQGGGQATLRSFGVASPAQVPKRYWDWLAKLSYYIVLDDYYLVHAGFKLTGTDPLKDTDAMLWIRNWQKPELQQWAGSRLILFGHTPQARSGIERQIQQMEQQRCCCIDGGCVYAGLRAEMGNLCIFDLDLQKPVFLPNLD